MDLTEYNENNGRDLLLFSSIPEACKSEPCVLGIDEAGRGPVLGPMVYACAFCPVSKKEDLAALGVDDSKALTEVQREALLDKIHAADSYLGWAVHVLSPDSISRGMYRRSKYNLNTMSHDTAAGLVRAALDRGADISELFVDTVGPPDKYQAKLQALFPATKVTVAKKADSLYPCVSAASICAKVARDRALREWTFREEGVSATQEWGSGYPGDEKTKRFLRENLDPMFGFPSLVRFSWKTAETLLEDRGAAVAFEEVDPEEEDSVKKNPSVKDFFFASSAASETKKSSSSSSSRVHHPYFTERGLKINSCF